MSRKSGRTWLRLGAEAIVVVGSILLALILDEWRVGLGNRELEQQYLQRLRSDLNTNLRSVESLRSIGVGRIGVAEAVYPLIARGEWATTDTATAVLASYAASGAWIQLWANDTFEELRSTGRMTLIRDVSLRKELIRYYGDLEDVTVNFFGFMPREYRESVRGRMEPEVQWRLRSLSCYEPTAACVEAVKSPGLSEYVRWLDSNEELARHLTRTLLFWKRAVEEEVPDMETATRSLLESIGRSADQG
jgi:hypothetical protein